MNHFFRMHSSYKKMANESLSSPILTKSETQQEISPVLEDTNQIAQDYAPENLSQLQSIFPLHKPETLLDLLKVHGDIQACVDILLEKEVEKQVQSDFQLATQMEKQ